MENENPQNQNDYLGIPLKKWDEMSEDEKDAERTKWSYRFDKGIPFSADDVDRLFELGIPLNFQLSRADDIIIMGMMIRIIIGRDIRSEPTGFTLEQAKKFFASIGSKKVEQLYDNIFKTGLVIRYTDETPAGKVAGYRFRWACSDEVTTESFIY